jgi:hypothetical protein
MLEVAESYAKAVWDTAKRSEAMPVIVARAITGKADAKAEGGAWREKPAAMRVYSLLARLNNGNLKLSPIGLALVDGSNPEGQKHARRQAVLGVTSYLQLLTDHNGSPLPSESTVATTFEFQYEVPPASAKEAAVIFAESVKYAGLLDSNGNIQIDPSEVPDELEPEASTMPKAPKPTKPAGEAGAVPAAITVTTPAPVAPVAPGVGQTTFNAPPPPAAGTPAAVGVNVTIDMSKWQADDVLSVLKVLGYGDSSD